MTVELKNFYPSIEDAQRRLMNTVVTYDGHPVYIHEVRNGFRDGIFRVYMTSLPGEVARYAHVGAVGIPEDDEDNPLARGALIRKRINSPKFNRFRPIPMGYANIFEDGLRHCTFTSRTPTRQSRQGLSRGVFVSSVPGMGRHDPMMTFEHIIETDGFCDMVTNNYPRFEEVLDLLTDNSSMALDRKFAIERDLSGLMYLRSGTERVGLVRSSMVLLAPSRSYLREEIVEHPKLPTDVQIF